jgi:DNA-binding PadR family transcriptional regulator
MSASGFRRSPLALAILGILAAEPMHPYGIQRRIKQWGKDQVVNVGQRSSLYKTITRLEQAGFVAAEGTDRDPSYPERTTYRITEAGQATAQQWLAEMIAEPRNEYPEFPAALSFAPVLAPRALRDLLAQRRAALARRLDGLEAEVGSSVGGHPLPRITLLDAEHQRVLIAAEVAWLDELLAALDSGEFSWDADELRAFAAEHTD